MLKKGAMKIRVAHENIIGLIYEQHQDRTGIRTMAFMSNGMPYQWCDVYETTIEENLKNGTWVLTD